jgi:hypothetical protein
MKGIYTMAASIGFGESRGAPLLTETQLIGGLRFDWLMGALSFLWMGGLYLDGWAHGHGKVDKTFFTPWHAILYSAFALVACCLLFTLVSNHRKGRPWLQAIPSGYGLSLLGVLIFACAAPGDLLWHTLFGFEVGIEPLLSPSHLALGVLIFACAAPGDLLWHTLFGFEVGIEPLLSPSHLALALGGVLVITGPLRATLRRSLPVAEQGWKTLLPMVLSLSAALMVFVFFTEFGNTFSHLGTIVSPFATNETKSFGATGLLLQAALLMGFLLFAVRRWRMPTGSLTLLFAVYVTLLSVLNNQYELIPGVVAAGIVADVLLRVLRPMSSTAELRVFAFTVPAVLYLCFFLTLMLTDTVAWSIHLWLGSCVMAGGVGLMLSFLLAPPRGPAELPEKQATTS